MLKCKYCQKECKSKVALAQHEIRCKQNPNRIISYFMTYEHQLKLTEIRKQNGCQNQYTKAKRLGLPKPICSEETRKKLSDRMKSRPKDFAKKIGKKISETVNEKVKAGIWHTSLAKRMHYNYKGNDLHGKWELAYAQWLDKQNIKWIRNKQHFDYIFENKKRRYTPDFYLPDTDEYIEIKGYETDKDRAKWSQFPKDKTLKVYKQKELKQLNII